MSQVGNEKGILDRYTVESNVDVCLIDMPYAAVERPSLALSILKSALTQRDISAKCIYGNLVLAEEIGVHNYDLVCKATSHHLLGDWTFAKTAFPDMQEDSDGYFQHVQDGIRLMDPFTRAIRPNRSFKDVLWQIRRQASAYVDRLAQFILNFNPRIVGCSSAFQQHCASLGLLRRLKELAPDLVTVLGGANCEASMGVVTHRECEWVDYVFSGESEIIFPQVCAQVLDHGATIAIKDLPYGVIGPAYRIQNGKPYAELLEKPSRASLQNIDDSPIPDYDDYFEFLNASPISDMVSVGLLMETSRGCWWGEKRPCTFCGLNGEGNHYRSKNPDRAIEEFSYLGKRYGIKKIEVVDNILDMRYFKTVIPTLAQQEEKYEIFYETKANLTREQLEQLADAGVTWIQPGIESLDDTLLGLINKGTTTRQNIQLLKWAQEVGISLIWLHLYDIPGEKDELYKIIAARLALISHLQPPKALTFIQYNRFSPYHLCPEKYHLCLSPERSYSFVYPWDEASLQDFVYCFDDYTRVREQILIRDYTTLTRPGLRALCRVYLRWVYEWSKRSFPTILAMEDDGEQLEITDTRYCALQETTYLSGLERLVYKICDGAQTLDRIVTKIHSEYERSCTHEQITAILQDLCKQKLMLELDGYYLSLATRRLVKPVPSILDYPGGRVLSPREIVGNRRIEQAEAQAALQMHNLL